MKDEKSARQTKRLMSFVAVMLASTFVCVFWGRFFLAREALTFVVLAALTTLFATNLLVLGIVIQAGTQSILHYVRKAEPQFVTGRSKPVGVAAFFKDRGRLIGILRTLRSEDHYET